MIKVNVAGVWVVSFSVRQKMTGCVVAKWTELTRHPIKDKKIRRDWHRLKTSDRYFTDQANLTYIFSLKILMPSERCYRVPALSDSLDFGDCPDSLIYWAGAPMETRQKLSPNPHMNFIWDVQLSTGIPRLVLWDLLRTIKSSISCLLILPRNCWPYSARVLHTSYTSLFLLVIYLDHTRTVSYYGKQSWQQIVETWTRNSPARKRK